MRKDVEAEYADGRKVNVVLRNLNYLEWKNVSSYIIPAKIKEGQITQEFEYAAITAFNEAVVKECIVTPIELKNEGGFGLLSNRGFQTLLKEAIALNNVNPQEEKN